MKSLITVSKLANQQLVKLLKANKSNQVLFAVQGGGCGGLKYQLEPVTKPSDLEATDLIKFPKYDLHLCQKSQLYLAGTHIDWQDDFMGQHFTFNNPNERGSCGCGSTFSV